MGKILVSFVHGYKDDKKDDNKVDIKKDKVPCLLVVDTKEFTVNKIISLAFPRLQEDFHSKNIRDILVGEYPKKEQEISFKKLPRFGVMGLSIDGNNIYGATWNGVYHIDKESLVETSFISNRLINDPHGIDVKDGIMYSVLTCLDLIVMTDVNTGEVIDYFSIGRDLSIIRNKEIFNYDWRFITKQQRGAVGYWHFNNVRVEKGRLYLTSRLTSSMMEVDLINENVVMRTICWDTPVMIHDGKLDNDNNIIFTSVDGKILVCNTAENIRPGIDSMDHSAFLSLMKRDLVTQSIRLGVLLNKEVNWCRGIEDDELNYITTTEGRYEQETPFFNITFVSKADNSNIRHIPVSYDLVDFPEEIQYMTGFSIELI